MVRLVCDLKLWNPKLHTWKTAQQLKDTIVDIVGSHFDFV